MRAKRNTKSRRAIPIQAGVRSRQEARTAATCRKLLDAAERIFARDGFEAARLADIASDAGYTRGAFYANFQSKEDIFFALLEEWVKERIETVTAVLRRHDDPHEKLAALRQYYAEVARNRRLVLISLEFKLFALRHPEAHARLQDRHRRIRAIWGNLFAEVLQELGQTPPISTPAISACLGALAHSLLLENQVDQKFLTESDVRLVLGLFFDSIFGQNPQKRETRRAVASVTKMRPAASKLASGR